MSRGFVNQEDGFTATEVLVAATVLSIVLLAVAGMFISGSKNIAAGGNRNQAAFLVNEKLEELRGSATFPPAAGTDTPDPGFVRSWGVTALTGTSPTRLATVSVTISWTDSTGPKSFQAATYLAEP